MKIYKVKGSFWHFWHKSLYKITAERDSPQQRYPEYELDKTESIRIAR